MCALFVVHVVHGWHFALTPPWAVGPWLFAIDIGSCDEVGHVWIWFLN